MRHAAKTRTTLFASALLATLALAGCMADSTQDSVSFDSYEDARSADGQTFDPDANASASTDVTLKLLDPADPGSASEGEQPIVFILYDSETDTPVTDATIRMQSRMPSMGHGTDDEVDPTHEQHGVYQGTTNHIMPGSWVVIIDAATGSGEYHYEIDFRVA